MWILFFRVPPPLIPPPPKSQLASLDVQARRFQRARLKPQARGGSAGAGGGGSDGEGAGGGVSSNRPVIQVALPRPAPDAVRPGGV
jgi:hypothetical protein